MSKDRSVQEARERAEALFKRVGPAEKGLAAVEAARVAEAEKTARLRALRLAKEAEQKRR